MKNKACLVAYLSDLLLNITELAGFVNPDTATEFSETASIKYRFCLFKIKFRLKLLPEIAYRNCQNSFSKWTTKRNFTWPNSKAQKDYKRLLARAS